MGGTGDGVFAIDGSGQIPVADNIQLDRETTSSFTLQITVSDGVNTGETVSVTVTTDLNDVVPVIDCRPGVRLPENAANGTVVGTVMAADGDVTATTFQNWTIVGGSSVFAIDAAGQITVLDNIQLDRETASSFTLQITVSDGVNTSTAESVTINLTDVNDVLPVVTAVRPSIWRRTPPTGRRSAPWWPPTET